MVNETNPLIADCNEYFGSISETISWDTPGLRIDRLRLISDPGFPLWDVSYCTGRLSDGTVCNVNLPFSQLPKRGMRQALYAHAKRSGQFIDGLFQAISTLN
jgi:hypothetical protein